MSSPLGEDTEAGGEDGIDDDHLTVHDGTAQQSETEESWTGVLEHFDSPVVNHQQDGHQAGDGAEQRHRQQHQSDHLGNHNKYGVEV